jgi:tetratricopeptide (TPR) repeat protein
MLSRSLRIEPDNVYAQNNLAIAYALSGNEERAIQLFTSAADKAIAYNNIGYLLMETGEWNRAERAFTSALELNPRFYVRAQNNLDQLKRMKLAN